MLFIVPSSDKRCFESPATERCPSPNFMLHSASVLLDIWPQLGHTIRIIGIPKSYTLVLSYEQKIRCWNLEDQHHQGSETTGRFFHPKKHGFQRHGLTGGDFFPFETKTLDAIQLWVSATEAARSPCGFDACDGHLLNLLSQSTEAGDQLMGTFSFQVLMGQVVYFTNSDSCPPGN